MALHQFRETKIGQDRLDRIDQIIEIVNDYPDQKLTARQVYYQFVSRGWLENNVKNYKNLTVLLTDARYAGLVDWDAIEDRNREPDTPSDWPNIEALVDTALRSFRLPRWKGQDHHVELWVEKAALAGILGPIARRFHITLMVNKGYSSASAMKDAAERMMRACEEESDEGSTKTPILLYLGDHDPSGKDMVRDIDDRLTEFGVEELEVKNIALTTAQVRKYNPPPNPAKLTDSRAKAYIEEFGDSSWELDALPPPALTQLVESSIRNLINQELMDTMIAEEESERQLLREAVKKMRI